MASYNIASNRRLTASLEMVWLSQNIAREKFS